MNIVTFNVGGKKFQTEFSTLEKYSNSVLYNLATTSIGVDKDQKGRILMDRSPKKFGKILQYMRDDSIKRTDMTPEIRDELLFYGVMDEKIQSNFLKNIYHLSYSYLDVLDNIFRDAVLDIKILSQNISTVNLMCPDKKLIFGVFNCVCKIVRQKTEDKKSIKISPNWSHYEFYHQFIQNIFSKMKIMTDNSPRYKGKILVNGRNNGKNNAKDSGDLIKNFNIALNKQLHTLNFSTVDPSLLLNDEIVCDLVIQPFLLINDTTVTYALECLKIILLSD